MSTKLAVIKTGGKQYNVKVGEVLSIEKLDANVGDTVNFETLLVSDDEGTNLELGKPSLGEKVTAKVTEQGKLDKVMVVKFKNKVRYTRNNGHRQPFTKVEISSIN